MLVLPMILLVVALILFIAAAAGYPPGVQVGWLGAAFTVLSLLVSGIGAH